MDNLEKKGREPKTRKNLLSNQLVIIVPGDSKLALSLPWLFARKQWPLKTIVETLVLLPLVMPPVSTGLILLKTFGRRSPLGQWLYERGIEIVFNWKGVLMAMSVMSFPLLVRSARTSFADVNPRLEQIAAPWALRR
jgi:molybdate transport system permease protein